MVSDAPACENQHVDDVRTQKRSRAPVDVFRFQSYRDFLAAFYAHKKPSGLSYRGFARAAGLGAPNYLKLVIDGKRNLSPRMAQRFAAACRLNEEATEYFTLLVALDQATDDAERNELQRRLSKFARFRSSQRLELAQSDYHSTWYIPAIRELVACAGFVEDAAWLAGKLVPAISEKQATHALEVLTQLGLVERDAKGRLAQASRAVTTGPQATGLHIRNYHKQMMEKAVLAMADVAPEARYISSLTLSADAETVNEVRRRVIEFRQELVALCDSVLKPTEVIQLNLQLFPLSVSTLTPSAPPPTKDATRPNGSPQNGSPTPRQPKGNKS